MARRSQFGVSGRSGRAVWCCQTKPDGSRKTFFAPSSGRELAPFSQGGDAVLLEVVAATKVAFEVDVIVDGGLDGGELLETLHRPESVHGFLSSPSWLMRVFSPVVAPPPRLLTAGTPELTERGLVAAQLVGHDHVRAPIPLHCLAQKLQCCFAIPALRDIRLKDFALVIDGAPKIMKLAVDANEHLVQMPDPVRVVPI